MSSRPQFASPSPGLNRHRLDSWKEIASYLRRGLRTVQRWETTEDLPVYRHLHEKLGSVYSYENELDAWWTHRGQHLHGVNEPAQNKILIAVLPFNNVSGDPEQEYFSSGLTEELIAKLGKLPAERVGVIARTSIMRYKGTTLPIAEIARELGVSHVLEGSVRQEGERVRVTARLIQASDQTHLWADTYEQQLTAVFAVQSELANKVASSLASELLVGHRAVSIHPPTQDMAAYEAYLRGRYICGKRTKDSLKRGIQYFEEAIAREPRFALAYAGQADAYTLLAFYEDAPPQVVMPKAKAAALKALEIDDSLGEAHASLADIASWFDWDWSAGEKEYKRAIELNPSYATARHWYAAFLSANGQPAKALNELRRARELDPLSLVINCWIGIVLYFARQYSSAVEELWCTLDFDPSFALAHGYLGATFEQQEKFSEAAEELKTALTLSGGNPGFLTMLGHTYAVGGRQTEARDVLEEVHRKSEQGNIPSYGIAAIYVGLGENDCAFKWLDRCCEEHSIALGFINVDPRFDPVQTDSRFSRLLQRIRLRH